MKRLSIAVLFFATMLVLTGCGGVEPNEIAYVAAVGIDSADDGNYKITIQYANPAEISGGEEGGDAEKSGVENFTVSSPDIYAAIGIADRLDSKIYSLSHTKLIVISFDVLRDGIKEMTDLFIRNEELKPDVYLAAAEDAQEYLNNINPSTEVNTAKYYQQFFDKNKLIGLPEGTVKNFFCGVETGDYDLLLPIARVTRDEDIGSAVFHGGKMVGKINEHETEIYKLLDNDHASGYLTMQNDTTLKNPVTIKTVQKKKPKYKVDNENKVINVSLVLEGDIYAASQDYNIAGDLEGFEKNCEEYINTECEKLMYKILREYKSDVFRLRERTKYQFLTNDEYGEYKKNTDLSDYSIVLNTDFDIRRTGLIVREG